MYLSVFGYIKAQNIPIPQYKSFKSNQIAILIAPNFEITQNNNKQHTDGVISIYSKKDRDSLYKVFKSKTDNDSYSDDSLTFFNECIKYLKISNTFSDFLTKTKKPKPFFISDYWRYNIDTINYYLLGQSKVATFQNITVQNFDESTTINAELGSFFFGPVRLGVSGSFNSKSDSADKAISKSIQQIFSNGGALGMNFSLPLFLTRDTADNVHFGFYAQTSFGLNPGFGPDTKRMDFSNNILFNNQTGFNLHFDVGSNDKKARLFFDMPILYSWASQNTYQQLKITDYSVVKLQVGASLGDLVSFKISGPLYSSTSTIQNVPFTLSLNFSPFNL